MRQFAVRVDDELADRIDAARGDVPRARWMMRAFERALESVSSEAKDAATKEQSGPASVPSVDLAEGVRPAASTRTPALAARHGVGPKPAAASKPRPKTAGKTKR